MTGYRPVRRDDIAVCIGAFFPAKFRLPRAHLDWVFKTLVPAGVEVVFTQVVRTGQNRVRPPRRFKNIVYHCDSVLFHKESLWNLAARATDKPKLLWIDGDVVFDDLSWIDRASELLDTCDLMQPFDVAVWLDRQHRAVASKKSAAYAFARDEIFDGRLHHPGFAWGMRRELFDLLDGFYELHPLGGGDTSFAIALSHALGQHVGDPMQRGMFANAPSYQAYMERLRELQPRVACQTNTVRHLWHGTLEKRQYMTRGKYAPPLVDGEYPVRRRQDGLLEWFDPEGDRTMLEYFRSREEDG